MFLIEIKRSFVVLVPIVVVVVVIVMPPYTNRIRNLSSLS